MVSLIFSANSLPVDWSFSDGDLSQKLSFSRASSGTRNNASGLLETIYPDSPRLDYNPLTFAQKGILVEPQTTNYIRNNTMVGALAPSIFPSNWGWAGSTPGIVRSVSEVGIDSGNAMPYIDIKWTGTATAVNTNALQFETGTFVPAVVGDTFTGSFYYRLVGGSLDGVSNIYSRIQESKSDGGYLAASSTAITPTNTVQRATQTRTMANAAVAYTSPLIILGFAIGTAVNITLRIYAPQLEKGTAATSVILTTGIAATRAADVLSFVIPNGVSKLRYLFDDNSTQDVTVSAGAYTVPTSLNRAWIKTIQSI